MSYQHTQTSYTATDGSYASANYPYAYSATPGHYIQMPQGPYGTIEVRPLEQGMAPAHHGSYYPNTQYTGRSSHPNSIQQGKH